MALSESECLRRIVRKGLRRTFGTDWKSVPQRERLVVAGVAVVHACGLKCDRATFELRVAAHAVRDELRIAHAIADYFQSVTDNARAQHVARYVSIACAIEYRSREACARAEQAVSPHLVPGSRWRKQSAGGHVGRLSCNVGPAWVLYPLRPHRVRTFVEAWTDDAFDWWLGGAPGSPWPANVSSSPVNIDVQLERISRALEELDGS